MQLLTSAAAQNPVSGSIHGVLMRWGTSEPVGQATVELRDTAGRPSPVAITASRENGEFEFSNIPPGTYRIVALADGYAAAEYGRLRVNGNGRPLILGVGERSSIQMGMVPGGIIAGRVTDQNGRPMIYSKIEILKASYDFTGQISSEPAVTVTTNDLGQYRAFWLLPGQYFVRAGTSQLNSFINQGTINPLNSETQIPTTFISSSNRPKARTAPAEDATSDPAFAAVLSNFYGGVAEMLTAQPVNLQSGAEVTGVDIRVAPLELSRRIRIHGTVMDPGGQPFPNNFSVVISKWPDGLLVATAIPSTARVPAGDSNVAAGAMRYVVDNGKFEATVAAGAYQLRVVSGPLSGRTLIDVSNQDLNVTIRLQPSASVSGRVRVEGTPTNAEFDLTKLQVGMRTLPAFVASGPVMRDGTFQIDGVIPGDYRFYLLPFVPLPENPGGTRGGSSAPSASIPAGMENAYVKSIRVGDMEVTDGVLATEGTAANGNVEIVVSLTGATTEGHVLNSRQEPADRATVVLLPAGPSLNRADRYRMTVTGKSGEYQFRGLPPGDYRLFAWEDVDPGSWFNPAFLAAFERFAMPFQVREGQRLNMDTAAIPAAP